MFSVVITVVNIRVAIETHLHHWLYSIVIFLSIASWWLCSWLFSLIDANGTRGVTKHMFASSTSWFAMALATWLCVIRIVAWKMYKRHFRSRLRHVVQEAQLVTGDFDKLQAWQEKRRSRSGSTTDTTPPQQHQQKQKQQQRQQGQVQPNPAAHWHSQAAGGGEQEAKPSSSSAVRPRLSRTRSGLVRAASDYHLYHSGADFSHDDSHAEYHADRLSRHGSVSGYHIRRRAMTVLGSTRGLSVRFAPIVAGTLGKYRLILLLTCGCITDAATAANRGAKGRHQCRCCDRRPCGRARRGQPGSPGSAGGGGGRGKCVTAASQPVQLEPRDGASLVVLVGRSVHKVGTKGGVDLLLASFLDNHNSSPFAPRCCAAEK